METVTPKEGIMYGFQLLSYLVALGVITWFTSVGTYATVDGGDFLIGFFIAVLGGLVVCAGLLGLIYKVISDAVQNGMLAATDQ